MNNTFETQDIKQEPATIANEFEGLVSDEPTNTTRPENPNYPFATLQNGYYQKGFTENQLKLWDKDFIKFNYDSYNIYSIIKYYMDLLKTPTADTAKALLTTHYILINPIHYLNSLLKVLLNTKNNKANNQGVKICIWLGDLVKSIIEPNLLLVLKDKLDNYINWLKTNHYDGKNAYIKASGLQKELNSYLK